MRRSARGRVSHINCTHSVKITVAELKECNNMLHKFKNQRQQVYTLAKTIKNYNSMKEISYTTGVALKDLQLNLDPDAKHRIEDFSNEVARLAQSVRPEILTGSNTVDYVSTIYICRF